MPIFRGHSKKTHITVKEKGNYTYRVDFICLIIFSYHQRISSLSLSLYTTKLGTIYVLCILNHLCQLQLVYPCTTQVLFLKRLIGIKDNYNFFVRGNFLM